MGYFLWMSLLVLSFLELARLMRLPGNTPEVLRIRRWANVLRLALATFLAAAFFLSRSYILTLYLLIAMSASLVDITQRLGLQLPVPRPRIWIRQTLAWQATTIIVVWLAVKINGLA